MFGDCFSTKKISPIDLLAKKKYVKLNDTQIIHALHFNERIRTVSESSTSILNTFTPIDQSPKRASVNPGALSVADENVLKGRAVNYTDESRDQAGNLPNIKGKSLSSRTESSQDVSKQASSSDNENKIWSTDISVNITSEPSNPAKEAKDVNEINPDDLPPYKVIRKDDPYDSLDFIGKESHVIIYKYKHMVENVAKSTNPAYESPILFFVHGVGGCTKIWTNQLSFFSAKGYELIAVDLTGHGESSVPSKESNYQFANMANDLVTCFDNLVSREAIIIGHSYGCSFATYLAQARKTLVRKLILISGGSPYPLDYDSILLDAPVFCIKMIQPCINCHFFCSAFSTCFTRPPYSEDAFRVKSDVLQYTMKGQHWPAANEKYHRSLTQHLLLIEGESDKFVPVQDAIDMVKIVKNSFLVIIKNGSHMVIMEDHATVNEIILEFVQNQYQN